MESPAPDPVGPTHATHTVAEVMRPAVTTVETTGHPAAAAYLMNRANQSALVVVDDAERPMAIIAEADLMRAVAHDADTSHDRIAEWMNRDPQTVQPDTLVLEVAGKDSPQADGSRARRLPIGRTTHRAGDHPRRNVGRTQVGGGRGGRSSR